MTISRTVASCDPTANTANTKQHGRGCREAVNLQEEPEQSSKQEAQNQKMKKHNDLPDCMLLGYLLRLSGFI